MHTSADWYFVGIILFMGSILYIMWTENDILCTVNIYNTYADWIFFANE